VVVGVGAAGSGPDPTRPVLVRGREGVVGESVESEATAIEDSLAGVGLNGWPNRGGTVVNQG
jgi:hypothetical protein